MVQYAINREKLRSLIGHRVHHCGQDCTVIEVLDDEPSVVLQCDKGADVIQPDQFGDPARRVPATRTVPVFGPDGQTLHAEFKELGTVDPRDLY